jgi:general secretion pathway protein G
MKLAHSRRPARGGFTLIELLVVVAIIAILVGLISAAVLRFMVKGPQTVTRQEIGQLESSVALFHKEFGLGKEYMPSRLILCERYTDYFVGGIPGNGPLSQMHQDSLAFLQRMFPKLWRTTTAQGVVVDWNNNGQADAAVLLEGDQCLVFFLGGIPTAPGQTPGCLGFSYKGSNPATLGGSSRKGPYFEFKATKLVQIHGNDTSANRYFSYQDGYQTSGPSNSVYAYFSSYRSNNGYNRFFGTKDQNGNPITTSDCATLGVWPYAEFLGNNTTGPRYLNPNTFQIVSAGADGTFGPGTDFSSATPQIWSPNLSDANIPPAAIDDQANFYGPLLGQ